MINDVLFVVYKHYEKYKTNGLEERQVDHKISITRGVDSIIRLLRGCNMDVVERQIAIDMLTAELTRRYYLTLLRRERVISKN